MLRTGHGEVAVAGGVESMSDVPIRHSRKMRQAMLESTKAKTVPQKLGFVRKLLTPSNWIPEVEDKKGTVGRSENRVARSCTGLIRAGKISKRVLRRVYLPGVASISDINAPPLESVSDLQSQKSHSTDARI